ncbi:MAG: 50S ribosomal protein L6 [Firmicutes bacterium]|nr:50S ribosomal protein L6 [Bacillota bacterium]
MSRIGKLPVTVPAGVEVDVNDSNLITVKGPKGTLSQQISSLIKVEKKDGKLELTPVNETTEANAQHGLARALVHNMVVGVSEGFAKKLEIQGVGYKAEKKGNTLVMQLGYSHPVEMPDPEGITTEVPNATEIIVKGADKAQVGNYAAIIRAWRAPEPYKGKGIRYSGEYVRRKEGKTGK